MVLKKPGRNQGLNVKSNSNLCYCLGLNLVAMLIIATPIGIISKLVVAFPGAFLYT